MEYIYFPFLYEDPMLYRVFPENTDRIKRGVKGPSSKLVHEVSEDVIIAE